MITFLYILEIILLTGLSVSTLYIFVFAVAGFFYRQPEYSRNPKMRKIAVLIPGYKEDDVIVDVARAALKQDYPSSLFDVVIIADSFQPETLTELRTLPIKVVEVKFEKSTKSKALNKAMEELSNDYEIAVILDADNLMALDFLSKINASFEYNYVAVQGHRAAKNMDTAFAILDAVSEEINNHIFRKGHRALGLSSAIIGSGMAFQYQFFKDMMATVKAVGGFDKELELIMLKAGFTVNYLHDAVVLDEKIQKAEAFSNQRRRWLSAQILYFKKDMTASIKALITKGNVDYFDKAFQFMQPPRILLLGAMLLLGIVFIALNLLLGIPGWMNIAWAISAGLCVLAFVFSIPRSFYTTETLRALQSLPKGMLLMFLSLLKIKGANKQFIHTKHGAVKPVRNI
ncbi:MAG: glycosyltransferase family 2 protein [Bacteroidales bacterium]|nr:glycosyltransferase family 2 protein [Bacteroidales bacterium]